MGTTVGVVVLMVFITVGVVTVVLGGRTVVELRKVPGGFAWESRSLGIGRRGQVDERARRIEVQSSLLLGLIPVGTTEAPLSDFARVKLEAKDDDEDGTNIAYTLTLVRRNGPSVVLFDGVEERRKAVGEAFALSLRDEMERLVGSPNLTPPGQGPGVRPSGRAPAAPPPGDAGSQPQGRRIGKRDPAA